MKISAGLQRLCLGLLLLTCTAHAQEEKVDPNRVFTTPLHWVRITHAARSSPLRYSAGSLAIFYQDGTYAAITGSFLRLNKDEQPFLSFPGWQIVRLGTWTRTDDDMIRIESREVLKPTSEQRRLCGDRGQDCTPSPEAYSPGPVSARTCRLDKPSVEHLSEWIHCNGGAGLTLVHPVEPVDLGDFPDIVKGLIEKKASAR